MRTSLPQPARIQAIVVENSLTRTLTLDASTGAVPGQFVMLWLPGLDEKPFSLVDDDPLTLTATQVGPFTQTLHELRVGDRLWWRGPFGHGFALEGQRLLLVGGGCGAAPLAFLARVAVHQGRRITVALGARTGADLLLVERFGRLGARVLTATDDGSAGLQGLVTELAADLLCRDAADALYGCGPEGMLVALEALGRQHRVPTQLSWETYMRCGMGICGSCARGDQLVCWDGPVFRTSGSADLTCQARAQGV